jgi:hypothetical protein
MPEFLARVAGAAEYAFFMFRWRGNPKPAFFLDGFADVRTTPLVDLLHTCRPDLISPPTQAGRTGGAYRIRASFR